MQQFCQITKTATHISNMPVEKLVLIALTFYASLILVMIAKTNLVDFGTYVSNKLQLTTISMGNFDFQDVNRSLKKPEYSRNIELDHFKSTEKKSMNSFLRGESFVQKEESVSIGPTNPIAQERLESTCNNATTKRGPHQLVVAFSYYGEFISKRNFFQGIEENAKLIKKFYPNWVMRVYTNLQPPLIIANDSERISTEFGNTRSSLENMTTSNKKIEVIEGCYCVKTPNATKQEELCLLQCTYPLLDICFVGNIPGFGNLKKSQPQIWRFLPMADPLVDTFVSRDLDSRVGEREAAAVKEWLSSNLTFHAMRDHPNHFRHFMGGMWGAVINKNREKLTKITKRIVDKGLKRAYRGLDQVYLKEILWPFSKGSVFQHDSYNCFKFSEHGNMNPWPTKRLEEPYNFVGSRIGVDKKPLSTECPLSCRPKDKQDWIHC